MPKRTVALLIAVICSIILASTTSAEAQLRGAWQKPGANEYTGDPKACLEGLAVPEDQQVEVLRQRDEVSVSYETFASEIRSRNLVNGDKTIAYAAKWKKTGLYVENMIQAGVPKVIVAKIEQKYIKPEAIAKYRTTIAPNDDFAAMCFTKNGKDMVSAVPIRYLPSTEGLRPIDPVYLAADGKSLIAYAFSVNIAGRTRRFRDPAVCHNIAADDFGIAMKTEAPQRFPIRPIGPAGKPGEYGPRTIPYFTIIVGDWLPKDIAAELKDVDGLQSRDIGRKIRDAAKAGKVPTAPGCHTYHMVMEEARFEYLRGEFYKATLRQEDSGIFGWLDMNIPDNFGKLQLFKTTNEIPFDVCNGVGEVTLPVALDPNDPENWVTKNTIIRIRMPAGLTFLYPPVSRTLQTCGPSTWGTAKPEQCGYVPQADEIPNEIQKALYYDKLQLWYFHDARNVP